MKYKVVSVSIRTWTEQPRSGGKGRKGRKRQVACSCLKRVHVPVEDSDDS